MGLNKHISPHTSAKAVLFARWQHHLRFGCGFPYAPLKAMVTKISKWSRIQDSFRITSEIESLVVFAIPDMPSKFQKDPSIPFWVILQTHRKNRQKHNLLGGGNYLWPTVLLLPHAAALSTESSSSSSSPTGCGLTDSRSTVQPWTTR